MKQKRGKMMIDNIDFDLLNRQRLHIHTLVNKGLNGGEIVITQEELDALLGIENLLDDCSDALYFQNKGMPNNTSVNIFFDK